MTSPPDEMPPGQEPQPEGGQSASERPARDKAVTQHSGLTSEQKAAIILQVLGPEDAKAIVERFDEGDFRLFARGMIGIRALSQSDIDAVIGEFLSKLGGSEGLSGGTAGLKRFLLNFLSEDVVEQIMEDVRGPVGRTVWEKLSNCPDDSLAVFLSTEQPQTAALVLSKLKPEKAAKVLSHLDIGQAKKVVLRMSQATRVEQRVLDTVKSAVGRDFLKSVNRRHSARQPSDVIGSIMNNLPVTTNDELLSALREKDEKLAESVQNAMFTFPDIATRLDSAGLQAVMKATDNDVLILALKLAKDKMPKVAEFFFSNMSKRALEQIEEAIEELGPVRAKDAEEAQQRIVRTAQGLASAGTITVQESEETEDDQLI
jgi:flagellar motor switch protein FliG